MKINRTLEDFPFVTTPLYKQIYYAISDSNLIENILKYNGTIDFYCTECKKNSTFKHSTPQHHFENSIMLEHSLKNFASTNSSKKEIYLNESEILKTLGVIHTLKFKCSRNKKHEHIIILKLSFNTDKNNFSIQKIGQYPSYSDITINQVKKYRKILGETLYSEFSKAIGLASHDIGIGSFVYLRRIFEKQIEEAYNSAKDKSSWNEDAYKIASIQDKIFLLKEFLPEFLSKNRNIYSILSKGIHELSEEECLKHFEIVKGGIELILDEVIQNKEREEKLKKISSHLNTVNSELSNKL